MRGNAGGRQSGALSFSQIGGTCPAPILRRWLPAQRMRSGRNVPVGCMGRADKGACTSVRTARSAHLPEDGENTAHRYAAVHRLPLTLALREGRAGRHEATAPA